MIDILHKGYRDIRPDYIVLSSYGHKIILWYFDSELSPESRTVINKDWGVWRIKYKYKNK